MARARAKCRARASHLRVRRREVRCVAGPCEGGPEPGLGRAGRVRDAVGPVRLCGPGPKPRRTIASEFPSHHGTSVAPNSVFLCFWRCWSLWCGVCDVKLRYVGPSGGGRVTQEVIVRVNPGVRSPHLPTFTIPCGCAGSRQCGTVPRGKAPLGWQRVALVSPQGRRSGVPSRGAPLPCGSAR